MKVRITKLFSFEMAHALLGYDGPCKNIHGHSYRLEITISGRPVSDEANPKLGMVMDFGDLKRIVKKTVLDDFDHSTVLNEKSDFASVPQIEKIFGNVILVSYQPTCENLLIDIRKRILHELPKNVNLESIRLHETATSFAEIIEADLIK